MPQVAPADAQTMKVVAAADAFIAGLTAAQKQAGAVRIHRLCTARPLVQPPLEFLRAPGCAWATSTDQQRGALMDLAGTVLSPTGTQMVKQQMDADDILKAAPRRGGRPEFRRDYYYVASWGPPSATSHGCSNSAGITWRSTHRGGRQRHPVAPLTAASRCNTARMGRSLTSSPTK